MTSRPLRVALEAFSAEVLTAEFDLQPKRLGVISTHTFNSMVGVDLADGRRLVLRIGDELRIHADGVEAVEAAWLAALQRDSHAAGPVFIADRVGRYATPFSHPAVHGERICSLFTWVRGKPLLYRCDEAAVFVAGQIAATLHGHAASFDCPSPIPSGVVANRVVCFEDVSLLANYDSVHGSLFVEAIERVQRVIDSLWASPPHAPHLLHGDFGMHNVMRWRDQLRPIDFQDLQFGFEVQDLGITLADLRRRNPEWAGALISGYRNRRAWPDAEPAMFEALAAGRSLNLMNLGLNIRRPGLDQFLRDHSERVLVWMRSSRMP